MHPKKIKTAHNIYCEKKSHIRNESIWKKLILWFTIIILVISTLTGGNGPEKYTSKNSIYYLLDTSWNMTYSPDVIRIHSATT